MPRRASNKASGTPHRRQRSLLEYTFDGGHSKEIRDPVQESSSPTPVRRKRRVRIESDSNSGSDSDVEVIKFEPRPSKPNDESDDEPLSPISPPRTTFASVSSRRIVSSDIDSDDGPMNIKRKRQNAYPIVSQDQDSTDEQPERKNRRLVKGRKHTEESSSEDLDESHILDTRLRSRGKISHYQQNLEKLKRKKGNRELSDVGSGQSFDEDVELVPFSGAKPDNSGVGSYEDEGSGRTSAEGESDEGDDFIVDDNMDENTINTQLPAAFSMTAHQGLSHHFKIVFQLFVHIAVRPLKKRREYMEYAIQNGDYFSVPIRMMRKKMDGVRDSVMSSVWRPKFRKTLETYPQFSLTELNFSIPHCDACHLGGRLSTLVGTAYGTPYEDFTFKVGLASKNDEVDEAGQSDTHEFNLGRFCAARTQLYHHLSHWEHNLFQSIIREVDELRHGTKFVRVGYSKGLLPPADISDADGVVDWLDQRGLIKLEWEKVKDMIDSSSRLEAGNDSAA